VSKRRERARGGVGIAAVVLFGLAACGCGDGAGGADAGTDTGDDTDTGSESQTDVSPDGWVGMPCTVDGDECAELSGGLEGVYCREAIDDLGFCTMECEPAGYGTSGQDPCGEAGVCADFAWLLGDGDGPTAFCVQACVPTGASNPCRADYLACDPAAWAYEKATATCLLPACEGDEDCPVPVGTPCADDGDCDADLGEECEAVAGALACVFCGECSHKTGRCAHDGADGAQVGDPCATTHDCGDNMICRTPTTTIQTGAKVIHANGYCVKSGCAAVTPNNHGVGNQTLEIAVVDVYGCGTLGVCHQGYYGGLCLRRCDPTAGPGEVLGCRQEAWGGGGLDSAGDYECFDQTAFIQPAYAIGDPSLVGSPATVTAPYCGWVGAEHKCQGGMAAPPNDSMTCEDLFGRKDQGTDLWGMGMECRDAETGEVGTQGYCLDETTSHWSGAWSDAPFDGGVDPPADAGPDAAVDAG